MFRRGQFSALGTVCIALWATACTQDQGLTGSRPVLAQAIEWDMGPLGPPVRSDVREVVPDLARLSMQFAQNRGQMDPRVRFMSRGRGYQLFLTNSEAVLVLRGNRPRTEEPKAQYGTVPIPEVDGDKAIFACP